MRDAHRMKEKFDVSLDNRQIVSLLIAGIVVMGAVFVLGVVVGKNLKTLPGYAFWGCYEVKTIDLANVEKIH